MDAMKKSSFRRGTYSPKRTRCILSYLSWTVFSGDMKKALL